MLKSGESQLQLFDAPVAKQTGWCRSTIIGDASCRSYDPNDRLLQRPAVCNLWLCILFPNVSLEAVASPSAVPAAVFTGEQGQVLICACNEQANNAGITPGMSIDSALALLPELDIRERQPAAEQFMLEALANWALSYTPVVSIDKAGALLLEVRGSLHLFGGLRTLCARLTRELSSGGHYVVMAIAPIARAAYWLARANSSLSCTARHELFEALRNLPIGCLGWPINVQQQLLRMGVHSLGQCVRLPRDGFARRIGPGYLRDLDQGFGRHPELLLYYRRPEVFSVRLELAVDIFTSDAIYIALEELFAKLAEFLRQRQVAARQLQIRLFHVRRDPTVLSVFTRDPCASVTHFIELSRLKLQQLLVPAPVSALSLEAPVVMDHSVSSDCLLGVIRAGDTTEDRPDVMHDCITRFIEQLRARLGAECVYGLRLVAEHRPEYAWSATDPCDYTTDVFADDPVNRPRPFWLFQQPLRLPVIGNNPVQQGVRIPLGDAERVESGWWDGRDMRRDYYRAVDHAGVRLWLYRDCLNSGWYLHGLFA